LIATGDDFAVLSPVAVTDGPVDHDLVAGLDTTSAKDTTAEITDDKGILAFRRINILFIFFFKFQFGNFIKIGQILQAAIAVGFAHQAVMLAGSQQ
jgi:hypothetical protein